MTMARAHLVDVSVTRWYHCITRCVRRAFLLADGPENRKEWIEHRLQELAEIFAVSVGGFSVMDNHLHVLVRLDPDTATGQRPELASPARETEERPPAGPVLRRKSTAPARGRRAEWFRRHESASLPGDRSLPSTSRPAVVREGASGHAGNRRPPRICHSRLLTSIA